jgi:hypothetical protein
MPSLPDRSTVYKGAKGRPQVRDLKFIRIFWGVREEEGRMGHEAERVILGYCIFSYTLNDLIYLLVGFTQHA